MNDIAGLSESSLQLASKESARAAIRHELDDLEGERGKSMEISKDMRSFITKLRTQFEADFSSLDTTTGRAFVIVHGVNVFLFDFNGEQKRWNVILYELGVTSLARAQTFCQR